MPFPDPILPIAIIAMVFALIVPVCLKKEEPDDTGGRGDDAGENDLVSDCADPFSESYDPEREDFAARSIVIETKFVEITTGTEELGFDLLDTSRGELPHSDERRK